jgi:hypothetical protein
MTQIIHEIQNPFDAYAKKLGYCLVMFMVAGSFTSNPQFVVKLYHKGDLRTVDQNDVKLYGNPAAGENLVPPIPEEWLTDEDLQNLKNKNQ